MSGYLARLHARIHPLRELLLPCRPAWQKASDDTGWENNGHVISREQSGYRTRDFLNTPPSFAAAEEPLPQISQEATTPEQRSNTDIRETAARRQSAHAPFQEWPVGPSPLVPSSGTPVSRIGGSRPLSRAFSITDSGSFTDRWEPGTAGHEDIVAGDGRESALFPAASETVATTSLSPGHQQVHGEALSPQPPVRDPAGKKNAASERSGRFFRPEPETAGQLKPSARDGVERGPDEHPLVPQLVRCGPAPSARAPGRAEPPIQVVPPERSKAEAPGQQQSRPAASAATSAALGRASNLRFGLGQI